MARFHKIKTLEGHLLRNKYPIVFSNHVDPFAATNFRISLPFLEQLHNLDLPVTIQTKGGRGLLEPFEYHCSALDLLKPSVFYISIETLDDGIAKKISSPSAPSPSKRLEMIQTLIKHGHKVCVGVNPVVPQWLPDPSLMVKTLHKLGVSGIWIQALHLSKKQISKMTTRGRQAMGDEILDQALPRNHKKYPAIDETLTELRKSADELGLAVYDSQQTQRSDYFEAYKQVYPQRYPLMQDFVNHCWDTKQDGDEIYFEEFRDMMLPGLPEGVWSIGQHIGSTASDEFWSAARDEFRGVKHRNKMSYDRLLELVWSYAESVFCPVNVGCFSWAADMRKDGWCRWIDECDRPILIFKPGGGAKYEQCIL